MKRVSVVCLLWVCAAAHAAPRGHATLFHTPPSQARPSETFVVEGLLVKGGVKIDQVTLHVRGPSEPYQSIPMKAQYGDLFHGEVPASQMLPPGIEYYVDAKDKSGNHFDVFMSAARPARVLVVGSPSPRPEPAPPDEHASQATEAPPVTARHESDPPARRLEKERAASAAAPAPPPSSRELDEELALYSAADRVTLVTRQPEAAKAPSQPLVLERDQLRQLAVRTVADVLDRVPGLTVSRDVSGFYRVAARGLRSDPETLFLIDGHPLNNAYDGRALWDLPIENLARIEITRGPGPVGAPAGAFLATINLVMAHEDGVTGAVTGGAFAGTPHDASSGSTGDFQAHVRAGQTWGETHAWGDAEILAQGGDMRPVPIDRLDHSTIAQGLRTDELQPAGYTNDRRLLVNAGLGGRTAVAGGVLEAGVRLMYEDRGAWVGLFDTLGSDSRLTWRSVLADVSYSVRLAPEAQLTARLWFDDQLTRRLYQLSPRYFRTDPSFSVSAANHCAPGDALASRDPFCFADGVLEGFNVGARSLGGRVSMPISLAETNQLSAGIEVIERALSLDDHLVNFDIVGQAPGDPQPLHAAPFDSPPAPLAAWASLTAALFAEDTWQLAPFALSFGFRVEALQVPRVDFSSAAFSSQWIPAFSPRIAASWVASPAVIVKASYARATRAPVFQELGEQVVDIEFNHGRFEGNPKLQAPVLDNLTLSADWAQAVGDARVRLRVETFYENITNAIAWVDTSGDFPTPLNRVGERVLGADGDLALELSRRARAWINASFFRGWDVESLPNFWLLQDVPQGRLNAGVTVPLGDWLNLDAIVDTGTERRSNSRSPLEALRRYQLPGYSRVDVQLRSELLMGHFEAALLGRNLFVDPTSDDSPRPDRIPGGVPREGFTMFLTVRATY